MKVKVGIIGITGYTGEELLKVLSKHPDVELSVVTSRSADSTKHIKEIYPHFKNQNINYEKFDLDQVIERSDVVFLALPHKVSFEIVPRLLKAKKKVIDLSADFRLESSEEYEKWYGAKHTAEIHLKDAVYGLPELYSEKISKSSLIANPGCYPTTVILGCAPVLKSSFVDLKSIIIDSKSGISGAGRQSVKNYYDNEHPNFRPYNIAGMHRHIPEIEQELSKIVEKNVIVTFTPQIIPVERGMLSTIYINLKSKKTTSEIHKMYQEFYKDKPFVRILDEGKIPDIRNVVNSNYCDIGIKVDERTNRLIIVSAIDNLVKGASGQAVQNMNIMCGFKETESLK